MQKEEQEIILFRLVHTDVVYSEKIFLPNPLVAGNIKREKIEIFNGHKMDMTTYRMSQWGFLERCVNHSSTDKGQVHRTGIFQEVVKRHRGRNSPQDSTSYGRHMFFHSPKVQIGSCEHGSVHSQEHRWKYHDIVVSTLSKGGKNEEFYPSQTSDSLSKRSVPCLSEYFRSFPFLSDH